MDPVEARALLEEFGVHEPGLQTVIAACYRAIDLITFLTTGDDETRAWEVRRGATAPEAAGAIHTDLQRGFIRAEVIGYDELVAAGSMDAGEGRGEGPGRGQGLRRRRGRHPARPVRRVAQTPAPELRHATPVRSSSHLGHHQPLADHDPSADLADLRRSRRCRGSTEGSR